MGGLRNWPGVRLHLVYAGVLAVAIPLGWAEPRVAVVILPVVCLLAAFGLDYLVRRLHCTRFVTVATAVALAALLTIEPATACWRAVQRDRAKDTRDLAADWFGENAAARAVILVSGTSQDVKWPYFPLPDLKRNLNERLPAMRRDDPGALRYWETELQLDRERRYDLRPESEGGEWATGSKMGGPGGVYVVGPGAWLQEQWAVGESVEVMAVFEPSWPESKGTQLEIWRLAPPAPVIPPVASSN